MFTEESFENVVIDYLKELNYDYIHGSNLTRDNKEVLLLKNLKTNLININKEIPESSIDYAIKKIQNFETNDVFTNNKLFHKYLTEGIEITDFIDGKTVYHIVKLIDFDNIENNEFLVANQLEIVEDDIKKIPDIIIYVNGIPLVCMELKSTSREEVSIEDAKYFGIDATNEPIRFKNFHNSTIKFTINSIFNNRYSNNIVSAVVRQNDREYHIERDL